MGEPPDLGLGTGVWVKRCDINLKHEECRRVTLLAKKRECFRPRDLKEQQPGSEQRLKHVWGLQEALVARGDGCQGHDQKELLQKSCCAVDKVDLYPQGK